MKSLLFTTAIFLSCLPALPVQGAPDLESSFRTPPDEARPWVFWFWINGNVSREGITKDLEAMKRVGIGGVIWMAFTSSVDFGYRSGGPHITPDLSMQKLLWSETKIPGGGPVTVRLPQPKVETEPPLIWLHPGERMRPDVAAALQRADSFRDASVFAFPASSAKASRIFRGQKGHPLEPHDGRGWITHPPPLAEQGKRTPLEPDKVIDLTDRMNADGELRWDAPSGEWTVVRLGHATNLKMTRPVPSSELGRECDREIPDTHV